MSSDPPIDNYDPKTQADETLKIALDAMASANAGHPPTLPHIRNVAGHALERIKELEAEVAELAPFRKRAERHKRREKKRAKEEAEIAAGLRCGQGYRRCPGGPYCDLDHK
jgi:hypothetical protein